MAHMKSKHHVLGMVCPVQLALLAYAVSFPSTGQALKLPLGPAVRARQVVLVLPSYLRVLTVPVHCV
jgi:hypothetical protein